MNDKDEMIKLTITMLRDGTINTTTAHSVLPQTASALVLGMLAIVQRSIQATFTEKEVLK